MIGARKVVCAAAALLLVLAFASAPAKAQLAGFGGGGGDMMTQMAPMLEMMKAKMGKKRFAMLMRTMGPMMSQMMDGGGFGGGAIPGGFGGGTGFVPDGYGVGMGGGDVMGMLGGEGGADMMSMIPQLMQMAHSGGGHGRRHHRPHS
ncbi:MAG TPA: hypothetical protein VKS24_24560 [Bradyrhizobium sp.]|nr:hypothetical protein [Bradyrhizobium sp.]